MKDNNILNLIVHNFKTFFTVFIVSAVLSLGISFILPVKYESTSTILIPEPSPTGQILQSIGGENMPLNALSSNLSGNKLSRYVSILESRKVISEVVEKFDLIKRYEVDNMEEAIEVFRGNSYTIETEQGALEVAVLDKNQDLVDNIVNFYINKLDSVNSQLSTKKARFKKQFYEGRVSVVRNELSTLQDSLANFQKDYAIINPELQAQSTIETITQLKAQQITQEIKYDYLQQSYDESSPELKEVKNTIEELSKKINDIKFTSKDSDFFKSFNSLPELSQKYFNLQMDIEIKQKILQFLVPKYEQSRIEEAKEIPTIQILDKGNRPESKAKPKRILIVLSLITISLLSTLLVLIYQENN